MLKQIIFSGLTICLTVQLGVFSLRAEAEGVCQANPRECSVVNGASCNWISGQGYFFNDKQGSSVGPFANEGECLSQNSIYLGFRCMFVSGVGYCPR